jgi:hypothetical protein
MMKLKKVLFWILAVIIALAAMVYQRMTGPTYPKKYNIAISGTEYEFQLPRSHAGDGDCPVEIELPQEVEGNVIWRRFPTDESWDTLTLSRNGEIMTATLPHQPPAGKIEYHLELNAGGTAIDLGDTENVVIRFKGEVPAWALIPHVLLMVFTVIWSMAILFFAFANMPVYRRHVGIALILLILGGFIMGPIVQKFSFGQFWTGWPMGKDLTDNKVLFALIAFIPAWLLRKKTYGRWLAIVAAIVMLAVYLIPHSMNGSQLDLESGEVVTGCLLAPLIRLKPLKFAD